MAVGGRDARERETKQPPWVFGGKVVITRPEEMTWLLLTSTLLQGLDAVTYSALPPRQANRAVSFFFGLKKHTRRRRERIELLTPVRLEEGE